MESGCGGDEPGAHRRLPREHARDGPRPGDHPPRHPVQPARPEDAIPVADLRERVRFRPTPAIETPGAMSDLVRNYGILVREGEDPLITIPLAIFDFLCIHPFNDGNGRVARLLTLLLLYKARFVVGRYISLERIFEETKETYYDTLGESSNGWHTGGHDILPWLSYFWGVLIRAYTEFESRVGKVTTGYGSKTEQVKLAVARRTGPFAISDIERECPGISRDMIRYVLRHLRDEGALRTTGVGRGAKWLRIGEE